MRAPHPTGRRLGRRLLPLLAAVSVAGCTVDLQPLSTPEQIGRVRDDLGAMFADQERLAGPVTLTEAVARALKYNLDHRLKVVEEAVALRQTDLADYALLPQLVATAGYTARSNYDASVSRNMVTGVTGTQPTASDEKSFFSSDLTLTWNILDFGISYIRARQQADYALMVQERRRQVVHTIVQEVRAAYWRAAAADRILGRVEPLLVDVKNALADAEQLEQRRLGTPTEALAYQKVLLETMRQLEDIRRQMVAAKTELAVLMNLRPGTRFAVAAADAPTPREPLRVATPMPELELAALYNRSELRSEAYQLRINQRESRVALLQMFPGLAVSTGYNYSDNALLMNQDWATGGARLTWNLMNLFSGPSAIRLAETREDLSRIRRLALDMAVISQTHIARLEFESAARSFTLAERLAAIETRLQEQRRADMQAAQTGSLEVIRARLAALVADLRRDLSYADMQAAYGRLFATIGADPLPDSIGSYDVTAIAAAVEDRFRAWQSGDLLPADVLQALTAPLPEAPASDTLPQAALQADVTVSVAEAE